MKTYKGINYKRMTVNQAIDLPDSTEKFWLVDENGQPSGQSFATLEALESFVDRRLEDRDKNIHRQCPIKVIMEHLEKSEMTNVITGEHNPKTCLACEEIQNENSN